MWTQRDYKIEERRRERKEGMHARREKKKLSLNLASGNTVICGHRIIGWGQTVVLSNVVFEKAHGICICVCLLHTAMVLDDKKF